MDTAATVWIASPRLRESGREFLTRLASFWTDEVYWLAPAHSQDADWAGIPNHWMAPVYDIGVSPLQASMLGTVTEHSDSSEERYLMPALGAGRAHMKVQIVHVGHASARLHSHAANDEYYLILSGRGTLRISCNAFPVRSGTLIAKPTGPDLASHILADQGEPVTVLDIEVWPDSRLHHAAKDVVGYQDHHEVMMWGPGWQNAIPQDCEERRRHHAARRRSRLRPAFVGGQSVSAAGFQASEP